MVNALGVSRRRVLIADDEQSMRDVVAEALLMSLDIHIATANDGHDLLAALAADSYDLVITDMMMPGPHGVELVGQITHEYPGVDIIVMTGFSDDFPYVEVVNAGATDFIVKPFRLAELAAKVTRVFRERATREAHQFAERKFESIFQLSIDGMVLLDRDSLAVIDANQAFINTAGCGYGGVQGRCFSDFITPRDQDRFSLGLKICGKGGTIGDVTVLRGDGAGISIDMSVTFFDQSGQHFIFLVLKDVTERREMEHQLVEAAVTDGLTGLYNKATFQRNLASAVRRAAAEGALLSLLMLDLDNFKKCNDSFGHQAGDELLRSLGALIQHSIRTATDEGFRVGGDEFAVIMCGADVETAAGVAERLRREFAAGDVHDTTLSIGVAQWSSKWTAHEFIAHTDQTLYAAKARGRNTVAIA